MQLGSANRETFHCVLYVNSEGQAKARKAMVNGEVSLLFLYA